MNLVKSKVVLLPCREYDEEKIYMLLKQGLDFLGGVETLIPKDAKILLKPNLLKKAEVEKAVITHPVVVGAFAGILRESGFYVRKVIRILCLQIPAVMEPLRQ